MRHRSKFTMLDILLILVEGQINSEFLTLVGVALLGETVIHAYAINRKHSTVHACVIKSMQVKKRTLDCSLSLSLHSSKIDALG